MTPELEIVIKACVGEGWADADAGASPGVDWASVLVLARRHRVEGLVWQHVTGRGLALPAGIKAEFEADRRSLSLGYLSQVAETRRICGLLGGTGIGVLVLKGCAIAQRLYAPRPELRHSIDIDLLVAPERLEAAEAVLLAEGYERVTPGPRLPASASSMARHLLHAYEYVHESGHKVELHHRLLADPYRLAMPFDRLLRNSEAIAIGDGAMRGLGLVDDFLYCCCHAANHAFFRLKWLADVHRIVALLGAEGFLGEAVREARRSGCLPHVLLSLRLLGRLRAREIEVEGCEAEARRADRLVPYALRALAGEARDEGRLRLIDVGEDLREMLYGMRLAPDARSRRFKALQHLANHEDLSSLRLGADWAWVYAVLGRPLALKRWIARGLRQSE